MDIAHMVTGHEVEFVIMDADAGSKMAVPLIEAHEEPLGVACTLHDWCKLTASCHFKDAIYILPSDLAGA